MKTRSFLPLLGPLLGLGSVALLPLGLPAPAGAQEEPRSAPSMACWRGAPRPACGGFFVVEAQGVLPFIQTERLLHYTGGTSLPTDSFESRLEWNLGYMVNVSPDWALGGAISLGTGSYDALTGFRARARRWLGRQLSLELQAGTMLTHARNAGDVRLGVTADARLNVGDHASFFIRWDGVDLPVQRTQTGEVWDRGGFQHALHLGVGTGSTWTVIGSGALAVWLAFVLAGFEPA